ncbi:MAG: hypothetical protein HYW24_02405 [Candidatus Aenigmarchaeota archaeon]|nr:hypothetical protein [Candidatus Aenigmarchaeota archaeon]
MSKTDYEPHRHIAVFGPIAFDLFFDESAQEIGFTPKWGGCGLNQALTIDRLCRAYGKGGGAYLVSSVGPDFYKNRTEAEFQGHSSHDILGSLRYTTPVLHKSDTPTTSFKVPAPIEDISSISNKRVRDRIEARHHRLESLYENTGEGRAYYDFRDPKVVVSLLNRLANIGYLGIISVTGGFVEAQPTIINAIRSYKQGGENTIIYYDPGPDMRKNPKLVESQLSKIDILRSNQDETYLLTGNIHTGPQRLMASHKNLMAIITTRATEISIYHKEGQDVVRTVCSGLPYIRTGELSTIGCGDVLGGTLLWYLEQQPIIDPSTIIKGLELGMTVVYDYLSQKPKLGSAGMTRFIPDDVHIQNRLPHVYTVTKSRTAFRNFK